MTVGLVVCVLVLLLVGRLRDQPTPWSWLVITQSSPVVEDLLTCFTRYQWSARRGPSDIHGARISWRLHAPWFTSHMRSTGRGPSDVLSNGIP